MIVVDNFLDQTTWEQFNDPDIWDPAGSGNYAWMEVGQRPHNVMQVVAKRLWNFFDNRHVDRMGVVGYEYWYNVLWKGNDLGWHYDKDEKHWRDTGEVNIPIYGSVLYPYHEVTGGYLEIQHGNEVERIQPVPNRAIFFSAGEEKHRVSDITWGTRKTFACNLWKVVPSEFR